MINFVVGFPIKLNIGSAPFKAIPRTSKETKQDIFVSNPIYKDIQTKSEIEALVRKNSNIERILGEYNIPLEINLNALEELKQGHMKHTCAIVTKIYSSLPENIKKDISLSDIQDAALLHDFGKVLIPEKILNKKGKLNENEKKIMDLHSELGYELLKTKGLNEKILNLVKYHHQNKNEKGYPRIDSDYHLGIDTQILSVADKYSALREKRSYKNPLAKYEALEIIAKEVNKGDISQEVYTALIRSV